MKRLTKPGLNDNEWAAVTCTPEKTTVEFFEYEDQAEKATIENIVPTTSTFLCKVIKQGESPTRGRAHHHAVMVEIDNDTRRALAARFGHNGRPSRAVVAGWLSSMLTEKINESIGSVSDSDRKSYRKFCKTPGCPCLAAGESESEYCASCRSERSGHGL